MVKIKLCGMTGLDDCRRAVELGVDYLGFVFYRRSGRYVTPQTVKKIVDRVGDSIKTVGVFVEERDEDIERIIEYCGLDLAQVYRPSTLPNVIAVLHVADRLPAMPPGNGLILFEPYSSGFGGSGRSFDFGLLRGLSDLRRAFVAGGIGEHNLYEVLRLAPYGVDLVSSLESSIGRKDRLKMERFVNSVRSFVP